MVSNFRKRFHINLRPALETLLDANITRQYRGLAIAWLVGLYIIGIIGFGLFFNWGNFDFLYQDWALITAPRLQFLRTAIREGQLPLHISDSETLHLATTRYLAVADVFISPQFLMLWKLPLPLFCLVDVWLLYSVGFAGLLVLRRKLRYSLVIFTALFLMFNFTGSLLGHFSAGHFNWTGYFFLPWIVWLIFRLLEGDHSWLWTTLVAIVLFSIWLQGDYHQFLYLLILLAGIGVFVPRTFWTVVRTGLATVMVCAFRILPCILAFDKYKQTFVNGYPSLLSIWDNLVNVPDPVSTPFYVNGNLGVALGEWELTVFIGLLGGLFLVYFGFYRGLLHRDAPYKALLAPLGILLLFSLGPVFTLVQKLPIPLVQGERATSRFFCIVLVFGLILGAERLQRWLEDGTQKPITLAASLLGLGLISFDLWQDARIWQITNRGKDFWIYFDRFKWYVKNDYADKIYIWFVFIGLAITLVSLVILGILSWKEHRRNQLRHFDHLDRIQPGQAEA